MRRAELSPLLVAIAVASALLGATWALAGVTVLTHQITVTETPGIIGNAAGRGILEVELASDAAAPIACGNMAQPVADWWIIGAGGSMSWGILYRGQYTGETAIGCVSTAGSIDAQINEEGNLPEATSTRTTTASATLTFTATPVNTATPTVTPTPVNTATVTDTPTQTPTVTPTNTP